MTILVTGKSRRCTHVSSGSVHCVGPGQLTGVQFMLSQQSRLYTSFVAALHSAPHVLAAASSILSIRNQVRADNKIEKDEVKRATSQAMKQLRTREKLIILLGRLEGSSFPADRIPDFDLPEKHPLNVLNKMSSNKERSRNSRWLCFKQIVIILIIYIGKLF